MGKKRGKKGQCAKNRYTEIPVRDQELHIYELTLKMTERRTSERNRNRRDRTENIPYDRIVKTPKGSIPEGLVIYGTSTVVLDGKGKKEEGGKLRGIS